MKKQIRLIGIVLAVITANIGVDQVTKHLARQHLKNGKIVRLAGDAAILTYAENDGAMLGFGARLPQPYKRILLVILPSVIIVVAGVYLFFSKALTGLQTVCLASIIGGGISNVADRILHNGMVTDFLNFGIGEIFRTGILNTADLSITFGVIVLMISEFGRSHSQSKT